MLAAAVSSLIAAIQVAAAQADDAAATPYLVVSTQQSDNGKGGTSFDRDTILVTPTVSDEAGSTFIYDLPPTTTEAERASSWKFPATIRFAPDGSRILVNEAEFKARIDLWLTHGGYTRDACGRWIFTWNAFKIECDPLTVLGAVEHFDLGPADLTNGRSLMVVGAARSGRLKLIASSATGKSYTVSYPLDPDHIRRKRAESDVIVGQILRKPVTSDAALAAQRRDRISGDISEQFDTDSTGRIIRRTTVTTVVTIAPDGMQLTAKTDRTLERRAVESSDSGK